MDLDLSRALHGLVIRLDRAADRLLRAEVGIGYAQFLTLYAVRDVGQGTQREVASWLGTTEAPVSRSLRGLAKQGLIEISDSTAPGHRRRVELTGEGSRLVESGGQLLERRLELLLSTANVPYETYRTMTERLLASLPVDQGRSES